MSAGPWEIGGIVAGISSEVERQGQSVSLITADSRRRKHASMDVDVFVEHGPRVDSQTAESLQSQARVAAQRTEDWLLARQQADGHWCAELQGDTILESEYILLMAWLGRLDDPTVQEAARYLLAQQDTMGAWALYPGGIADVSVSVKAYLALKLAGHAQDADAMRRAAEAIRALGGADAVNSFTRFYLALFGQISFELCPAVPPEMLLLPNWGPINVYRMSAWSRTIFVPLSIVWACRAVRDLPAEQGISELFLAPPEKWPPLSSPGGEKPPHGFPWSRLFRGLDRGLKLFERLRCRPLRGRALRAAEQWMLERFDESDGLGAIFPAIVWSRIALACLGYEETHPAVRDCHAQLERLMLRSGDQTRLQPCLSPVWDTALSLRALATSSRASVVQSCQRAAEWLLNREVRRAGDWSVYTKADPSGWCFEYQNAFYPDVDDTAMVLMGLHEIFEAEETDLTQRLRTWLSYSRPGTVQSDANSPNRLVQRFHDARWRACDWLLAMQNRDGGWGAFDCDNDAAWLCHVPFADHNAMIDPSTPDITARVLEALIPLGLQPDHPAIERAMNFLFKTQESDGAWPGRWGVNYIYGTWQVLAGLQRCGLPSDITEIRRAVAWLLRHQQSDGSWGESPDSYFDPSARGRGTPTASQTAWALLGLIAAGQATHPAVTRGVAWLIAHQQADGSWHETAFTGTGFPRVFYLRYHYYPIYFPLQALRNWLRAQPVSPIRLSIKTGAAEKNLEP